MCVRQCVRASVRICPDHNLYKNARISKHFGTVVALEEEKCHLKHFRLVKGQGHRGQIKVKMVINMYLACLEQSLYIYARISKKNCTVVALEEE